MKQTKPTLILTKNLLWLMIRRRTRHLIDLTSKMVPFSHNKRILSSPMSKTIKLPSPIDPSSKITSKHTFYSHICIRRAWARGTWNPTLRCCYPTPGRCGLWTPLPYFFFPPLSSFVGGTKVIVFTGVLFDGYLILCNVVFLFFSMLILWTQALTLPVLSLVGE